MKVKFSFILIYRKNNKKPKLCIIVLILYFVEKNGLLEIFEQCFKASYFTFLPFHVVTTGNMNYNFYRVPIARNSRGGISMKFGNNKNTRN